MHHVGMNNHLIDLQPFAVPFEAQWSDMDQNGHMRTTAYLAVAENTRKAELRLLDTARIELCVAGLSEECARLRMRNTFVRSDGRISCTITTTGGWLGLKERRFRCTSRDLVSALRVREGRVISSTSRRYSDAPGPNDHRPAGLGYLGPTARSNRCGRPDG